MNSNKITINWDDLKTRRVDNRLREQQAVERNRSYAQLREDGLPVASTPAKTSIWNSVVFYMSVFGLVGGMLAWGAAALVSDGGLLAQPLGALLHYDAKAQVNSARLLAEIENEQVGYETGRLSQAEMNEAMSALRAEGSKNPYFLIASDSRLTHTQRQEKVSEQLNRDRVSAFILNVVGFGICGMMLALCLAIAEPITQRKWRAAAISGLAGAVLGLAGGAAAALLSDRIAAWAGAVSEGQVYWIRNLATHAAVWGTLGLFLGLGSGLVMRNARKVSIGLVGGLLGGVIGGVLFDPVRSLTHDAQISRLIALIAIGVVAGLCTGWIEDAAKSGWLKVTSGIIAGKQFILYRNPTYIGSSPDCQIYLFKDPKVGKRHAAIHLAPAGIEIEDLPLGVATLVNGKPITRARIKNGDTIEIGATSFRFQEKRPGK